MQVKCRYFLAIRTIVNFTNNQEPVGYNVVFGIKKNNDFNNQTHFILLFKELNVTGFLFF